MKKVLFAFAAFLLSFSFLAAQGDADLKKAAKAYDSYSISQDMEKLSEAVASIQTAMEDAEVMANPQAYIEAGDIYAAVMNQVTIIKTTKIGDMETLPKVDNPAVKAADAYLKAYQMFEKKGKKKNALSKLSALQGNLENAAIFAIQESDFSNSFINFDKTMQVHDMLIEKGLDSYLDETKLQEDKYYTGYSAIESENFEAGKKYYQELIDAKYEEPNLYDGMYKIYLAEGDKEKAVSFLEQGRAAHPDDTRLLFSEINYYLAEKKLDVLLGKLQGAIEKEPNNPSLYATLGSVNENLFEAAKEEGNAEKADGFFNEAKKQYEMALEKDPEYSSAIYSIGALYFNRGASYTQEQQKLSDDLSKAGTEKYNKLGERIESEFSAALPYFKRAEKLNPNDTNILIALKEIFARQNELVLSKEFQARYETVSGGGVVESYFATN